MNNTFKEKFDDWYINISGQNYVPAKMITDWIEKWLAENQNIDWKKRCEAAEAFIDFGDTDNATGANEWQRLWGKWQQLKSNPTYKEGEDEIINEVADLVDEFISDEAMDMNDFKTKLSDRYSITHK